MTAGGGTIDSTASTNDAGIATSGSWTLGPTSTEQRVTAKAETAQVEFSATGRVPCTTACPARRQLAFVRSGDIYVANEDGSDLVRLTSGGMFGDPAWSPDGRQIAAVRGSSIYLINADGSGLRLFAAGWSPAWSPDGRRIAFSGRQALESDIFLQSVENEGEPPIRIGFTRGYIDGLTWSPDGSRIAFVSDWAAFDIAFEIYVVNADGSNVVQITHGLRDSGASWPTWTIYAQPAWSPDGRRLAVVACEEWQFYYCERSSVGVMDADGMGFRLLAQTTGFAKPSWAPDGSAVMFSRTCWEYRCASNLFEVAVDGGNERVVIANGHSGAWRP